MGTSSTQETLANFTKAIESHDYDSLFGLFAEDAAYTVYSERSRPSASETIRGRTAIRELFESAPAELTHQVSDTLAGDNRFSIKLTCIYPTGGLVVANIVVDLQDGAIVRYAGVEAWDL